MYPHYIDSISKQLYEDLTTDTLFSKFFHIEILPSECFSLHEDYTIRVICDVSFSIDNSGRPLTRRLEYSQIYTKYMLEDESARKFIVEGFTRVFMDAIIMAKVEMLKNYPGTIAMSLTIPMKPF